MSIALTSLAKIAVGILAGTVIIAPVTYSLSGGETNQQKEAEYLGNNKDTCWTFIEGTDEEGDGSRQLLICTNPDSSNESFSYYLYTKDKEGTERLSPKVKTVSFEQTSQFKLVFGFVEPNGKTEALWTSYGLWDFLKKDYDLETKCTVSLEDSTRKIDCAQSDGRNYSSWLKSFPLSKPIKELINA
ncbi:hypothetical protein DNK47_02745 [Mycoplasma wenyonii]|uniref:Uncharacterized protein n=1 Tax=Mycoplasma wenyonii TaxID=65123 RepID=A0A328PTQ8_9MOLU|nr:hypothetical protein [Mycoplasma wenyonii]RAO94861.1 hypothetical protein DNK47_02745 [Mycoplasma wenyonii]